MKRLIVPLLVTLLLGLLSSPTYAGKAYWRYVSGHVAHYYPDADFYFFTKNYIRLAKKAGFTHLTISGFLSETKGMEINRQRLAEMVNQIHAQGLKVNLKPHILGADWVKRLPKTNRAFFKWYTKSIVKTARLAEENDIEILTFGTELSNESVSIAPWIGITEKYEKEWDKLIDKIRAVYSGKLSYAANSLPRIEWNVYENVVFWDRMDIIGIDLYPTWLVDGDRNPSVAKIVRAWHKSYYNGDQWKKHIRQWKEKNYPEKFLILSEMAFPSWDGAVNLPFVGTCNLADEPFLGKFRYNRKPSLKDQRDQIRGFHSAFRNEDWLDGVDYFLWYWGLENHPDYGPCSYNLTGPGRAASTKLIARWVKRYRKRAR